MMRKRVLWIAMAAAATGIAAGCGGGSGSSSGSAASGGSTPQAGTASGASDAFFSEVARVIGSSPDNTEPMAIDATPASSPDDTEPSPLG
jgi:hypothetical protein